MNGEDIRKNTFRIGAFRVEPTRNLLKKEGQSFPLEPRIMDVLCELADTPGEVIARFDLIKRIWKVDYGADESLTRAISVLRKTFRKGGETEKYIETISKVGYRLIAHVGPWEQPIERVVTAVPKRRSGTQPEKLRETRPDRMPAAVSVQAPIGASAAAIIPPAAAPIVPAAAPAAPHGYMDSPSASPANATPRRARTFVIAGLCIAGLSIAGVTSAVWFGGLDTAPPENTPPQAVTPQIISPQAASPETAAPLSTRPLTIDTGLVYGNAVAVLSFSDMSLAGDQEYFADGMAEELLTQLYTVPNLRVISRQASFAFKGQRLDPREIGRKLQVSHIIAGSVRTNSDLVRVSAQLINAQDASQLWVKSYTGKLSDGFAMQEQIARDAMTELAFILDKDWEGTIPEDVSALGDPLSFSERGGIGDDAVDDAFDVWSPTGPPQ